MHPAELLRELNAIISSQKLAVEVLLDIAWIFLRKPDFTLDEFGNFATRNKYLGKWIASFPREIALEEVKRLLPLIHMGTIKVAKFTNICNSLQNTVSIVVYCIGPDTKVAAALEQFGWSLRWKYNFETFSEYK